MNTVYVDYNATTPLDAAVREVMLPFLGTNFGNPSSVHRVGQRARAALDDAREKVARIWNCKPGEIVFTGGGTESVNSAIFGAARKLRHRGRHLITSAIEHHAVLHSCQYLASQEGFRLTCVPVDSEGIVAVSDVEKAIKPDTVLVSIMAANNETGALQPVVQVGDLCRQKGILFHTDAVQWFGKEPFASIDQFHADLVSLCAHKFYGPRGAGALFVRSPLTIDPILFGGSHENERRAGTENLAAIAGLAEAMERFIRPPVFHTDQVSLLAKRLVHLVDSLKETQFQGSRNQRLCNTVAFTVEDCDSLSLLAGLDLEGVCASSGSACTSGSLQSSHVIEAMGVTRGRKVGFVRFSLGRENTEAEIDAIAGILPKVIRRTQMH